MIVPMDMKLQALAAGNFTIFTPQKALDARKYSALVQYQYGEWLPMSGYLLNGDYSFDQYTMQVDENGDVNFVKLEVFLPVRRIEK